MRYLLTYALQHIKACPPFYFIILSCKINIVFFQSTFLYILYNFKNLKYYYKYQSNNFVIDLISHTQEFINSL